MNECQSSPCMYDGTCTDEVNGYTCSCQTAVIGDNCEKGQNYTVTRSTQRAQTSLAEADHYSHIAHCKNVEPWMWKTTHPPKKKKKKKRFWIITCTTIWVCYHYYGVFFAHLLILQYPDHHQNLISSSLYYSGPVHKISPNPFITFWVMLSTDKQTDRQTNKQTN